MIPPSRKDRSSTSIEEELITDLMSTSDAELLREVAEDDQNVSVIVADVQALLSSAVAQVGCRRLAVARAGLANSRRPRAVRVSASLTDSQRKTLLTRLAGGDARLQQRVTMAARGGEGASEADIDSMVEDLMALGALDAEGEVG